MGHKRGLNQQHSGYESNTYIYYHLVMCSTINKNENADKKCGQYHIQIGDACAKYLSNSL